MRFESLSGPLRKSPYGKFRSAKIAALGSFCRPLSGAANLANARQHAAPQARFIEN
jgi:hypothetical protein